MIQIWLWLTIVHVYKLYGVFTNWQISYDNKIAAGRLISSRNSLRETFVLGFMDALLLRPNMRRSAPEISVTFLQIFHKPPLLS